MGRPLSEDLDVDGIRVSILTDNQWKSSIPPEYHFPYVWADLHIGTAEQRKGKEPLPVEQIALQGFSPDAFLRLTHIHSVRTRITLDTISGGSLRLQAENPYIRVRDREGSIYYKRAYNEDESITKGDYVWYYSVRDVEPPWNGWFKAVVVSVEGDNIELDFKIPENKLPNGNFRQPTGNINRANIFPENPAGLKIVPMQRIVVFGLNRFDHKITSDFKSSVLLPGTKWRSGEVEEYFNELAARSSSAIFTGYINDVTVSREGARQYISIAARDVLQWAEYSLINVNPAVVREDLGVFGRDPLIDPGNEHWQIFQQRFAGVPVPDIIRAMFFGASIVNVNTETVVRQQPNERAKPVTITGPDGTPTEFKLSPGLRVFVVQTYPPTDLDNPDADKAVPPATSWARVVDRFRGISGWVQAAHLDFRKGSRLLTGLGRFTPFEKKVDPVYPGIPTAQDIVKLFQAGDRLSILENEGDTIEETEILRAYNRFFRVNFPSFQSTYQRRLEILRDIVRATNTELYADQDGVVNFHPVRAYLPVDHPTYVAQPEETISWAFTETDREVATWVYVTGQVDYNTRPTYMIQNFDFAYEEEIRRFGLRALQINNPNIHTPEAAKAFARSLIRRFMANRLQGEITLIFRPEIRVGRNIYIPWLRRVYYIHSVEHTITWGQTAVTTLGLKYGRYPWQPWKPLDYGFRTETQKQTKQHAIEGRIQVMGELATLDGEPPGGFRREMASALQEAKLFAATCLDDQNNPVLLKIVEGVSRHEGHDDGYAVDITLSGIPSNGLPIDDSQGSRERFSYVYNIIKKLTSLGFRVFNYYLPNVNVNDGHRRNVLHCVWIRRID